MARMVTSWDLQISAACGEPRAIEGADADDDLADAAVGEQRVELREAADDRHALDPQPALRRVVVYQTDWIEPERGVLEQDPDQQRAAGAGAVDEHRPAAPATVAEVLIDRGRGDPRADQQQQQQAGVDREHQPREALEAIEAQDQQHRTCRAEARCP